MSARSALVPVLLARSFSAGVEQKPRASEAPAHINTLKLSATSLPGAPPADVSLDYILADRRPLAVAGLLFSTAATLFPLLAFAGSALSRPGAS